jgi:hypothetical protein
MHTVRSIHHDDIRWLGITISVPMNACDGSVELPGNLDGGLDFSLFIHSFHSPALVVDRFQHVALAFENTAVSANR